MTLKTLLCGSALAMSSALVLPCAAGAQVTAPVMGIASASPTDAIFGAKAWAAAYTQILGTTYKPQVDQLKIKGDQRQALLLQLDKNGDKQVDDAEMAANSAVVAQVTAVEREMQPLDLQIKTANAYVLDTIAERYKIALQTVIRDRKISFVLSPEAFVFAPPTTDITPAIIAEINRILPTVAVPPPTGWQVTAQGAQLLDQWNQLQQAAAQQRANAAAAAPRPATPAAGTPARPATQQPASR